MFKDLVEVGDGFIGIGEEDKGELVFLGKFLMTLDVIGAYTEDRDLIFLIRLEVVSELASLFSTAWCIVFRVEVEDDVLAFKVVE